jgi:hypothetical protein
MRRRAAAESLNRRGWRPVLFSRIFADLTNHCEPFLQSPDLLFDNTLLAPNCCDELHSVGASVFDLKSQCAGRKDTIERYDYISLWYRARCCRLGNRCRRGHLSVLDRRPEFYNSP